MRKLFYPSIIIVIIFFSCTNNNVPNDIIPANKMELVLWDYFKVDAYCSDFVKKDSTQNDTLLNIQLQQTIFRHYKITKEEFYRSYQFYKLHPVLMAGMLDSMGTSQRKSIKLLQFK